MNAKLFLKIRGERKFRIVVWYLSNVYASTLRFLEKSWLQKAHRSSWTPLTVGTR